MAEKEEKKKSDDAQLDKALLKGLVFKGSTGKKAKDEESGRTKTVYVPFERALEPGDVMSFREEGDEVVICTTDGRKHRVKKIK